MNIKNMLAILVFVFCLLAAVGCGRPDQRVIDAIDTAEQVSEFESKNADRIWVALINQYRKNEMKKIEGFYAQDVKTAETKRPKKPSDPTKIIEYGEALIEYAANRATYLAKSEMIKQSNIEKLNFKIGEANAKYEKSKRNRMTRRDLLLKLREYETARIDPVESLKQVKEILQEYIELDE